ncbi:histone-lysine N-methyltransferase SETMAR [Trichonephila clavipes]|uniref:Histone-lysine N-methyltransferase SETMAR n=1 Tax=Trichonephila clavipes TaxID=2585209 RepID=A0A8X6SED1_TRICX|nr:histone-lysine N-methyltransferase SETMAR [Trichonephila clavipes]
MYSAFMVWGTLNSRRAENPLESLVEGEKKPPGYSPSKLGCNPAKSYCHLHDTANDKRIFDVKDAPRTGRPVVENVDKITEIIEVDQHVSSRSIARELKIDQKSVLNHLRKIVFKKKLHVWVPQRLTRKNMMDRISICEALAKRNEIDPFLKRMMIGDEKWVTCYNIVRMCECECGV